MNRYSARGERSGRHLSGGFTLDEAAHLYETRAAGAPARCPGCGDAMRAVSGSRPSGLVSLFRCETCGRGLVFDRPRGVS